MWKDYIRHYSLSIIPLRNFISSFSRLGDLRSAYKTLQHMVALAIRGSIFVNRSAEGKLYSSRVDIPIPSNDDLEEKFDLEGNDHHVPSIYCKQFNSYPSKIEQCTPPSMVRHEAGSGFLNKNETMLVVKLLQWSFSDVMHVCAKARNCRLAEQLILQVG